MDFIEDFNLLEIYSDYVKEPFFLNLEEIIDLFDTSSIEKTKERIKILFTENAEFLTERMFSKNEIFYRGRVGFNNEKGAIDDCDINVTFPYCNACQPVQFCKINFFQTETFFFSVLYKIQCR